MKYCTHCGNSLKPGVKFCGRCGHTVPEIYQSDQIQTNDQVLCPECCSGLSAGSRFCKVCGAKLVFSCLNDNINEPIRVKPGMVQAKPVSKKHKWISILVSFILIIPAIAAFLYFSGTYNPWQHTGVPGNNFTPNVSLVNDSLYEYSSAGIEVLAQTVDQVFMRSDTASLARILAPSTLEKQRKYFAMIQPHMQAFADDFKNRKLLYANQLYAVYQFECSRGKFTVDFCLGEDGKWKLLRY